ncbi:hypothetical protein N8K70_04990 [Microbacterium betulae]|uniref:CBU-0592-like domain-containing protein n=1 Tax=Microbacterium betulae TaxID=2981139 RepID=A0AA97FMA9_9MICO|nr:hypothetical protein [Microbacterium sp. AB]WOF24037.1 hypothetical protein N8K70_04990 [Microbacterium sp. AB]
MDDISAGVIGWLGTLGTFGAYALLWRGRVGPASRIYAVLNTLGGLLGAIAGVLYGAWPSVASNVVWAAVGLHTLVAIARRSVEDSSGLAASAQIAASPTGEDATGAIGLPGREPSPELPLPVPAAAVIGLLPPLTLPLPTSSIPVVRIAG